MESDQRRENSFDDVLQQSSKRVGRRLLIVAPIAIGINRSTSRYDAAC
jgi:hypothetical protein